MTNKMIVEQEHGKDSIVEIMETTREAYPQPVPILSFYTDQSLASNSGRAWNVRKAIKNYCLERGYRITGESPHEIIAQYDPRQHSYQALDSLRRAVQEDAVYKSAVIEGKQRAQEIQDVYGPAIAALKKIIHSLESQARNEFSRVANQVATIQELTIDQFTLPPHLLPNEQEMLHRPLFQPEFDHYAQYQIDIDDNIDPNSIMALL